MSSTSTGFDDRPEWAVWSSVLDWQPFDIDALGLVTLLGAEEVNAAVGRLVRSRFVEYLPVIGAFVIAGDRFRESENGWNLYNLTDGIHTTALSAWLTRWTHSQDFERTRSYVVWTVTKPRSRIADDFLAFVIGFVFNGFLIAFTILSYDWYGFANAVSMAVSVLVRWYVVGANRDSIDAHIEKVTAKATPKVTDMPTFEDEVKKYNARRKAALKKPVKFTEAPPNPISFGWHNDLCKCLILTADSRAVTMMIPKLLILPPSVFVFDPVPKHIHRYRLMRMIGWVAFAVQIIALGMSALATQLYTIGLIIIPTMLLLGRFGCDDSRWWTNLRRFIRGKIGPSDTEADEQRSEDQFIPKSTCWIGRRLKAETYEWPLSHEFVTHDKDGRPLPRSEKRQHLDAWLQLTEEEEESMDKWDLIPHKRPHTSTWMETYMNMKKTIEEKGGGPYSGPVQRRPTAASATAATNGGVQEPPRPTAVSTSMSIVGDHPAPVSNTTNVSTPLEPIPSQTIIYSHTDPTVTTTHPHPHPHPDLHLITNMSPIASPTQDSSIPASSTNAITPATPFPFPPGDHPHRAASEPVRRRSSVVNSASPSGNSAFPMISAHLEAESRRNSMASIVPEES